MLKKSPRKALVLGATGGVGGETAAALLRHGWRVDAIARDPGKIAPSRSAELSGINWIKGDAMQPDSIIDAAKGASIIVHAVNPPGYKKWDQLVIPMIKNTISAARASGARILLPGTIYNYGIDAFPLLSEDSMQFPSTSKGKIRVQLEALLEQASHEGVRSLIVRAGDFYGPRPGNNWFSQGMVKPGKVLNTVSYPGKKGVGHAWCYLPDLGETFAQLADRESELEDFSRFHFAGHWDADGTEIISAIRRATANPNLKVKSVPWGLLAVISPFSETVRALCEIRFYWNSSVKLDNRKLTGFLGKEPQTTMDEAIQSTLEALKVL